MSTSQSTAPTITPLVCGWLIAQERILVAGGGQDQVRLPIPAWLVDHPKGPVLFDAGLHPDLADGPESLGPRAKYFAPELDRLREMEADGLLDLSAESIQLTDDGRYLVRNVCMVFDAWLERDGEGQVYSKTV